MTALDWVFIAVVGISAIFSIVRGFVREVASIISWVTAFVISGKFYPQLAQYLTFSDDALTRNVLAIIISFVLTLVVVGFTTSFACRLIKKAGLSGMDRLLGVAFGVIRGILILSALLALLQILFRLQILTFIQEYEWWSESIFIPDLQRIVNWFFIYMGTSPTTTAGA